MACASGAESSSSALSASLMQILQLNQQYELRPHLNTDLATPHDIFLSHSGAQKGFVKDLHKELSQNFSTFLDITRHSLPLGEDFPRRILDAARTCKLGVVVMSEEFVSSKWPMIELEAFVSSGVKILPLFFRLSPSDLRNESNLSRWVTRWEAFAKKDSRISVSSWKRALKSLGSKNGLTFDAATEGELTYLDKIVSSISQIVPPSISFETHHVHGKDRLCQVIFNKLKEMETQQHHDLALSSSANPPPTARPMVLGLYGLPGSGKSTLCKCLHVHFSPIYFGKALYLELPTNPSPAELVNMFKMLLRLTDFGGRIDLDYGVSNLDEVEWLLRRYQLQRQSIFLVFDNISDRSWDVIQRIFLVGFGPGSKIILVARTLDILLPTLNSLKRGHHCICDSMQIPNIDEREAKEILIQTTRAGTVDLDGYVPQQHLNPKQTEIVLRVVRVCGFGSESSVVYLPLVMKIMGGMFVKYKGDLEEWGIDLERFWAGVETYKEDAVKQLVEESFKTLPNEDQLQVLFMDVALFIVPSKLEGLHEVSSLLGFMHDKSESRMEKMLKDLERYCFLTVDKYGVRVHDVYLEFAMSLQENSSAGFMKWSWIMSQVHSSVNGETPLLKEEQTTKGEHPLVRTVILEVEGCNKIELQSFSGLKAVVVRGCKSLRVLRFAGLSSLVSLEIVRCAGLQQLDCRDNDYISLRNVKRLVIVPETKGERTWDNAYSVLRNRKRLTIGERSNMVLLHVEEWEQVPYLQPFINLLQRAIAPAKHCNLLDRGIARHMRGLQVLSLEETGIRRLDDMSSYWPQLQDLRIKEYCLESLVVGNLQKLKRFHFNDGVITIPKQRQCHNDGYYYYYRDSAKWKPRTTRLRQLQGSNLLEGCPELENVCINSASFQGGELGTLPQKLVNFELSCFHTATKLPDLSYRLDRLVLRSCEKLERVDLPVGLRNLRDLELWDCLNVVEVSGLGLLASLRRLSVIGCPKLQALVGSFNNLTSLEWLEVFECEKLRSFRSAEFEDVMKLEVLRFPVSSDQSRCKSLKNLTNLEVLDVKFGRSGTAINKTGGLFQGLESLVKLRRLRLHGGRASAKSNDHEISPLLDFSSLVGLDVPADDDKTLSSGLCSLESLALHHWPELAGIDGIQHLLITLTELRLTNLENLKSLAGLEFLIHLDELYLQNCPLLAELPSLHALVNMRRLGIRICPEIKAVEGCHEMKGLVFADFDGCESMSCLPFSDLDMLRDGQLQDLWLSFRGCKFAKNLERVVAWAVEEATPRPLRLASLDTLAWEYYRNEEEKESVAGAFFACLYDRLLPNGDDRIYFPSGLLSSLQERWSASPQFPSAIQPASPQFPSAAALEWERKLRGKPILQNFQMHKLALLHFLDDAEVKDIMLGSYSRAFLTLFM